MTTAALPEAPQLLADVSLAIDPAEVLRFQGYDRGVAAPPRVRALVEEALALGARLMQPRAVVRWARVTRQDGDTLEAAGVVLRIPGVTREWHRVDHLAAGVCTIGEALEERVRALWSGRDLALAAMLDSVGSGAVETLAEYVSDLLSREALLAGVKATHRMSPGYRDWPVRAQRELFALVPAHAIGVDLNEACFMRPEKTISLLLGAGADARVDHASGHCARCWMAGCAYRRVTLR